MATPSSASKFDQKLILIASAERAGSEDTNEVTSEEANKETAPRGPLRKAAQIARSEKVWVGAAPTGKKPVAVLKRKPSMEEVSTPKAKKTKGGPVVGLPAVNTDVPIKSMSRSKAPAVNTDVPIKSTSRSKAPAINADTLSSADEFQVQIKPKVKKAKIDVVATDLEDSGTDDKSDRASSVSKTESESSDDGGLTGDRASVRRQLQAERTVWFVKDDKACTVTYPVRLSDCNTSQPQLSYIPDAKMSSKKMSHCENVQVAETLKFAPRAINIKAESQEHLNLMSTPESYFSTSMNLVEQVGRPLALLSQSRSIKDVIHESIERTLEGIVFVSGFPPVADRAKNGRLIVIEAAAKLGQEEIKNRCEVDTHYVDEMAKVAEARICSLRKVLKDKATTHIVAQYQLRSGCKDLVTALLAGRSYIFPGDMTDPSTIQRAAPYGHPIFAVLLAEVFFKTKLSLGNVYPHHFTNSIEGGDVKEAEVPPAMLELIATAVHAALLEWIDGYYQPAEFSYNRCSDIYDLHFKTLKTIFDFNIHGFHRTLYNLYKEGT